MGFLLPFLLLVSGKKDVVMVGHLSLCSCNVSDVKIVNSTVVNFVNFY